MKLKIAIIDDEHRQTDYLSGAVSGWASKNRHVINVKCYSSAKAFLFDYSEEKDFDILLLDIEMPEMNGIELAKAVRRENSTVQIVFITGYYEYFSDGFDVSALHYLIKPAASATKLPCLITARLFRQAPTKSCCQTKKANTISFGTHRHSIIQNNGVIQHTTNSTLSKRIMCCLLITR